MKMSVLSEAGVTDSGVTYVTGVQQVRVKKTGSVELASFEVNRGSGTTIFHVILREEDIPELMRLLLNTLTKKEEPRST